MSVSSPAHSRAAAPVSPVARILWPLLNAVQLVYTLLWSAGCITLALLVRLALGGPRLALAMARRLWAPGLLLGAGARVVVEGAEALDWTVPHLFAASHQSIIDIPTLFVALPIPLRFIVKRELRAVPFLGWYVAAMGMVFIDRQARHEAVAALRNAAEILRAGASLVCFPEGTRSRDGALRSFKNGAFAVAIEAQVPVVPVAIEGAGAVLPSGGFRVRPGTIRVRLGQPIETVGRLPEERGALARQARAAVLALRGEGPTARA